MLTESDQNLSVAASDGYQVARGTRCGRVQAIAGTVWRILTRALACRQGRNGGAQLCVVGKALGESGG